MSSSTTKITFDAFHKGKAIYITQNGKDICIAKRTPHVALIIQTSTEKLLPIAFDKPDGIYIVQYGKDLCLAEFTSNVSFNFNDSQLSYWRKEEVMKEKIAMREAAVKEGQRTIVAERDYIIAEELAMRAEITEMARLRRLEATKKAQTSNKKPWYQFPDKYKNLPPLSNFERGRIRQAGGCTHCRETDHSPGHPSCVFQQYEPRPSRAITPPGGNGSNPSHNSGPSKKSPLSAGNAAANQPAPQPARTIRPPPGNLPINAHSTQKWHAFSNAAAQSHAALQAIPWADQKKANEEKLAKAQAQAKENPDSFVVTRDKTDADGKVIGLEKVRQTWDKTGKYLEEVIDSYVKKESPQVEKRKSGFTKD